MDAITRARRLARRMLNSTLVVMWIFLVMSTVFGLGAGTATWPRAALATVAALGFTWIYVRVVASVMERRYPTREVVWSGALAFLSALLGGADPMGWGFVPMVWVSVAVIGLPGRRALALGTATCAACVGLGALSVLGGTGLLAQSGDSFLATLLIIAVLDVIWATALPCTNRMWAWIWSLAVQAHDGREAHTRLALAEERLRFARDLHDLVGHQLSAIAVKTELAVRLADADGKAARAEMSEVNTLTRKALRELRQAVRGYRELDLTAELNSVKGVLEAAGVRCEVRLPHRELPPGVAPVFAYAVREAVTNVLKHSAATFCDITLRFTDQQAELAVRNDGVARRQADDLGSGLTGMGERMAAVGGSMTARPTGDGHFLLTAVVSLPIGG
ncbi:sensor histidine kinase [Nonomuraea spiralis]|uniref:sensor histidine kinase n=1 Tax=Nonomuraea TaxID=83681 RepID=UPI000F7B2DA6|nr:histidine kinase [Nonomuraea sp. WAC 01424]RSN14193.1 sensor histidine kinase [Nonomuraea sp. WAC 01424]